MKNLPRFPEIDKFLSERGFTLYALYRCYVKDDRASFTDAMYINPDYQNLAWSRALSARERAGLSYDDI
jgi:hypothetical protein